MRTRHILKPHVSFCTLSTAEWDDEALAARFLLSAWSRRFCQVTRCCTPPRDYAKPLTDSRKLIKWNRLRQVVQTGSELLIWVKFVCIVCYRCACELYWAVQWFLLLSRQKNKRKENKLSKRVEKGFPCSEETDGHVSGFKWSPRVHLFCTASWLKTAPFTVFTVHPRCHCLKAPSLCKTKTGWYVSVHQSQRNWWKVIQWTMLWCRVAPTPEDETGLLFNLGSLLMSSEDSEGCSSCGQVPCC